MFIVFTEKILQYIFFNKLYTVVFSRLFGNKVIAVKPLIQSSMKSKLMDHRDKNVRQATKLMYVEIFRWIKDAIKAPLQNINATMVF